MEQRHTNGTITTGVFTVPPSAHARRSMTRIARAWWWAAALPAACAMAMGTADWRWLIAAMALLLAAYPAIAMAAWFSLLTSADAIRDLRPHAVTVSPGGTVTLQFPPAGGDGNTHGNRPKSVTVTRADADRCTIRGGYIEIPCSGIRHQTVIIPLSVFQSTSEASEFFFALTSAESRKATPPEAPIPAHGD